MLICTPIGWMWNWWHYKAGVTHAWDFGTGETFGFLIFGIPVIDWLFYIATGAFFIEMIMLDPVGKLLNRFGIKGIVMTGTSWETIHNELAKQRFLKSIFMILLVWLTYLGVLVFGRSGTITAVTFGVPSIIFYLSIFKYWDFWHFIRTGFIVVPTNILWEIWATPITKQWYYNSESGLFNTSFWIAGIPLEMTPYLGIMAWYYIFGVVLVVDAIPWKVKAK